MTQYSELVHVFMSLIKNKLLMLLEKKLMLLYDLHRKKLFNLFILYIPLSCLLRYNFLNDGANQIVII